MRDKIILKSDENNALFWKNPLFNLILHLNGFNGFYFVYLENRSYGYSTIEICWNIIKWGFEVLSSSCKHKTHETYFPSIAMKLKIKGYLTEKIQFNSKHFKNIVYAQFLEQLQINNIVWESWCQFLVAFIALRTAMKDTKFVCYKLSNPPTRV